MKRVLRGGSVVMGLLFILGAAVQLNDPDPWRWVAIYLLAAIACGLFVGGRLPRALPVVVGLLALLWGVLLAPGALGRVGFLDLFREIRMDSVEIEVGREAFGLVLIALWMGVLSVAARAREG